MNKEEAHQFIVDTYRNADIEQLRSVRQYYFAQTTNGKESVALWFYEKLNELIFLKESQP